MDVANNFVGEKANRKQLFGKFSTNDVPVKVSFFDKIDTNCGIVNSVSIYLTWIFVCLMDYLLTSVFWRKGGGLALFKPTYSAPQLLQPCYGPVTIFFCSGKSENDLSVRDFSSHRACTFILQSLRLPFNLCTSLEELYFRDWCLFPFPAWFAFNFFIVVRRLFCPQNVSSV